MSPADTLDALMGLPDDTPCELTVGRGPYRLGDLKARANAGPATLTTVQAAARFGWTPGYWRDVAKLAGVGKDRFWRLPVEVCERHMAERQGRPRRRRPWAA